MGAGLAVIIGPQFSKLIMRRMEPRYCCLLSTCFSATAALTIFATFEETLPPEKRKTLDLQAVIRDMQPFSFLQIMGKSPSLRKMMTIVGVQTCSEGRNLFDVFSIFMQQDLNWSWDKINNFVGTMGI